MQANGIPLVKAAAIAGKGYHAMLNAVLRGECRGWQDDRGRWLVDAADAQRLARERGQGAPADVTATSP